MDATATLVVQRVAEEVEFYRQRYAEGDGAGHHSGGELDQDVVLGPVPFPQPVDKELDPCGRGSALDDRGE